MVSELYTEESFLPLTEAIPYLKENEDEEKLIYDADTQPKSPVG